MRPLLPSKRSFREDDMTATAEIVAAHFDMLTRAQPCTCNMHGPVDEVTDPGLDPGPRKPTPPTNGDRRP